MSLDVYLSGPTTTVTCTCRECGHEHTRESTEGAYWSNITHNLNRMAREAGIYEVVWRPEEVGVTHARQLIEPLRGGIARLKADPAHFEQFNSSNGWGLYINFVPWLEQYLAACEANPDAEVSVSR